MTRTRREVWRQRVEEWKSSGLTAKEYAAKAGVDPGTLAHWKWQFGAEARARGAPAPSPAIVEVVAASSVGWDAAGSCREPIELVLASGMRIRLPPDFEAAALRRVLDTVEGR
jgi:hypothetical protein